MNRFGVRQIQPSRFNGNAIDSHLILPLKIRFPIRLTNHVHVNARRNIESHLTKSRRRVREDFHNVLFADPRPREQRKLCLSKLSKLQFAPLPF